jgi:hypothetical protein
VKAQKNRRMYAVVSRGACTTLRCVYIALILRVSCTFTMLYFSKTLLLRLNGAAILLSMRFYCAEIAEYNMYKTRFPFFLFHNEWCSTASWKFACLHGLLLFLSGKKWTTDADVSNRWYMKHDFSTVWAPRERQVKTQRTQLKRSPTKTIAI